MRYLITGAAGHLGNTIVRYLLEKKEDVRGFILQEDMNSQVIRDLKIACYAGDVLNIESLNSAFDQMKGDDLCVIHTAGIISIASIPSRMLEQVNIVGTKNVIETCLRYNTSKFVYISSVHAIAEKDDDSIISETKSFSKNYVLGNYAKSKAEATKLVLEYVDRGLKAIVVHPSGIIGPYDYKASNLTQLILDCIEGRLKATVKGAYDFVDVRDVAFGTLAVLEKGEIGECYILSGSHLKVSQLVHQITEIAGVKKIKSKIPMWVAKLTAPLAELYYLIRHQPPLYTPYSLYTLSGNARFSHAKATEKLDYHPRDICDTLKDTIAWLNYTKRITMKRRKEDRK